MLTDRLITAAVFALIHSLWQAFIIALLLMIFTKTAVKAGSKLKYSASFFALITVSASSAVTFIYYFKDNQAASAPAVYNINDLQSVLVPAGSITASGWQNILESNSWLIFALWFAGMTVFFIKFCVDLYYTNSIRRKDQLMIPDAVSASFYIIAEKLGIKKAVVFIESPLIKVPAVIGYLKPVVILPLGLVSKIPSDQLEAVISHELAHIARNDFLHNLIQSLIEIVYFFNPSVFIISGMIRSERENCCDDLAVTQCGDSALLAKGLYNLELIHNNLPGPVMAAAGKKKNLLCRIKRLIGKENDMTKTYSGFFASLAVLTIITVITGCTLFAAGDKEDVKNEKEIKEIVTADDGGSDKNEKVIVVKKNSDDGTVTRKVIVTKGGENCEEIMIDGGSKMIFISDDDEDIDIDIDIESITEAVEKALEEIDRKDLTDEKKAETRAKVKEALEKLKNDKFKAQALANASKAKSKQVTIKSDVSTGEKSSTIMIKDGVTLEIKDKKFIITGKDGKTHELDFDKEKPEELQKKLQELGFDTQVKCISDDENDVMIWTTSDDDVKDIRKVKKIKMNVSDKDDADDIKWFKKIDSGEFDELWKNLIADGLFKEKSDDLKIEIDNDEIEINDKEIPANLLEKYKKLLERK